MGAGKIIPDFYLKSKFYPIKLANGLLQQTLSASFKKRVKSTSANGWINNLEQVSYDHARGRD